MIGKFWWNVDSWLWTVGGKSVHWIKIDTISIFLLLLVKPPCGWLHLQFSDYKQSVLD